MFNPLAVLVVGGLAAGLQEPAAPPPPGVSTPRAEKYALFVAESQGGAPNRITGWEYDPRKPEAGLVRRADFAPSGWTPAPLFPSWAGGTTPEFLRQQVDDPKGKNGYIVHLYRVDYATWEVKRLLVTPQVIELAVNSRRVYIDTNQGVRWIDRKTDEVKSPEAPFEVVRLLTNDLWIVETGGKGALFDLEKDALLDTRVTIPDGWRKNWFVLHLSPDRRRIAYWNRYFSDDPARRDLGYGKRMVLSSDLHVLNLSTAETRTFRFRASCAGGSGNPVISNGPRVEWSADGASLTCVTLSGDTPEQVTLDAATLVEKSRTPAPPMKPYTSWERKYFPEWLKVDYEGLERASEEGGRRLALAFLQRRGVDLKGMLTYMDVAIGFSEDGKRALLRHRSTGHFYFLDLEANELRPIKTPPELTLNNLEIHWVAVP
ncbi:MAG TPA: hypothetical protein VM222_01650 [Planctomycetota bacterium]|nr:hypothetical protein [Planctomycetota bacterium]